MESAKKEKAKFQLEMDKYVASKGLAAAASKKRRRKEPSRAAIVEGTYFVKLLKNKPRTLLCSSHYSTSGLSLISMRMRLP